MHSFAFTQTGGFPNHHGGQPHPAKDPKQISAIANLTYTNYGSVEPCGAQASSLTGSEPQTTIPSLDLESRSGARGEVSPWKGSPWRSHVGSSFGPLPKQAILAALRITQPVWTAGVGSSQKYRMHLPMNASIDISGTNGAPKEWVVTILFGPL